MVRRYPTVIAMGALAGFMFAGVAVAQKVEVKTNQAPNTDFKVFKTYAWLPPVPVVKNVAPTTLRIDSSNRQVRSQLWTFATDLNLAKRKLVSAAFSSSEMRRSEFVMVPVFSSQPAAGRITSASAVVSLGQMSWAMTRLMAGLGV